jgi:hypothetical protein
LSLSSCKQPLCRTAAGQYAFDHQLKVVSTFCARGGEGPCVLSFVRPGGATDVSDTVTLACDDDGDCHPVGGK